jgi:UrcA family protein
MKTIGILAVAAVLAAPTLASATPAPNGSVQVSVRYSDLDLNRRGDDQILLHRIRDAALEACGASQFSVPDYRWAVRRSACYRSNVRRAAAEVGLVAPA